MNRYSNIQTFKTETGKRYRENVIYPSIPVSEEDVYLISTAGDRYDTLALQYYKDSSLWWIIASANNSMNGSLIPTPGVQLRIPADHGLALRLFQQVNSAR